MANATPSRLGQINSAGDPLALLLKVFGGEVLTTFNRESAFRSRTQFRTIDHGKSAQFPVQGIAQAYQHTPGDEILGQKINASERIINIEGLQVAPIFVPNIDEWMNHYDVRAPYAVDIGQALAKLLDQNIGRVLAMAARTTTPNVLGVFPGDTLTSTAFNALYGTSGIDLFNALLDAKAVLDSRDVPASGRSIFVDPIRQVLLLKSEKPIDRRLNPGDDQGGYSSGELYMIGGSPLVTTNNMPNANDITNINQPASRQHDFSTTRALYAHSSAAGTVAIKDIVTEAAYDIRRQGYLMLGKFLAGHDKLRVEAAYELQSAAPAG